MRNALRLLLVAVASASPAVAADFVVTNTNSSGPGSLYQAITDANNAPGSDRILFNIPGSGVHTISVSPDNPLPTVSESLDIDAYSQPGAKPNGLERGDDAVILVRLDGGGRFASPTDGLVFYKVNKAATYAVRGLCFTGFGPSDGLGTSGAAITAGAVDSLVVAGNFIGVLPDGETAAGNYTGVGPATKLGGTDPASRNVISGNFRGFAGEARPAPGVTDYGAVVQGNYIGTDASGTKALPNVVGIALGTEFYGGDCADDNFDLSNTVIGGTASGAANLISGNRYAINIGSVKCRGVLSPRTYMRVNGLRIEGNLIGVQPDGATPLSNGSGIIIEAGNDNVVGGIESGAGNVIAFSNRGVIIFPTPETEGNKILSNSIYGNSIGIDLGDDGSTPNDPGDADSGPNTYQNWPVIESAMVANGAATIQGSLNSTPNTQFTIQYFSESLDLGHPVQTYLGSSSVTTDANGNAQFSATFPLIDSDVSFNTTATSQVDGNTSEFWSNPPRMLNLSTRLLVQSGDRVAIAGLIVNKGHEVGYGTDGAYVIVRALGPSLLRRLGGVLADPRLEIYDSTGKQIAANDNWRDSTLAENVQDAGLAPLYDSEAALALVLDPGSYTAVVRGAGDSTGVGLVEVYTIEVNLGLNGEAANISTRGFVGTGDDDVMIAGTILQQITGSTRIVARALGPSLAAAGVSDPLADPTLELHDANGATMAANDDWREGQPDALTAVGLAPTNDNESAIFAQLQSGAYTAIVRGKDDSTGIALVELYNLH